MSSSLSVSSSKVRKGGTAFSLASLVPPRTPTEGASDSSVSSSSSTKLLLHRSSSSGLASHTPFASSSSTSVVAPSSRSGFFSRSRSLVSSSSTSKSPLPLPSSATSYASDGPSGWTKRETDEPPPLERADEVDLPLPAAPPKRKRGREKKKRDADADDDPQSVPLVLRAGVEHSLLMRSHQQQGRSRHSHTPRSVVLRSSISASRVMGMTGGTQPSGEPSPQDDDHFMVFPLERVLPSPRARHASDRTRRSRFAGEDRNRKQSGEQRSSLGVRRLNLQTPLLRRRQQQPQQKPPRHQPWTRSSSTSPFVSDSSLCPVVSDHGPPRSGSTRIKEEHVTEENGESETKKKKSAAATNGVEDEDEDDGKSQIRIGVPTPEEMEQFCKEEVADLLLQRERLLELCEQDRARLKHQPGSILDGIAIYRIICTLRIQISALKKYRYSHTLTRQSIERSALDLAYAAATESVDESYKPEQCPHCPEELNGQMISRGAHLVCPVCAIQVVNRAFAAGAGWEDDGLDLDLPGSGYIAAVSAPSSSLSYGGSHKQFTRSLKYATRDENRPGLSEINKLRFVQQNWHTRSPHQVRSTYLTRRAKALGITNVASLSKFFHHVLQGLPLPEISLPMREHVRKVYQYVMMAYPLFKYPRERKLVQKVNILRATLEQFGFKDVAECLDGCKLIVSSIRVKNIMQRVWSHAGPALRPHHPSLLPYYRPYALSTGPPPPTPAPSLSTATATPAAVAAPTGLASPAATTMTTSVLTPIKSGVTARRSSSFSPSSSTTPWVTSINGPGSMTLPRELTARRVPFTPLVPPRPPIPLVLRPVPSMVPRALSGVGTGPISIGDMRLLEPQDQVAFHGAHARQWIKIMQDIKSKTDIPANLVLVVQLDRATRQVRVRTAFVQCVLVQDGAKMHLVLPSMWKVAAMRWTSMSEWDCFRVKIAVHEYAPFLKLRNTVKDSVILTMSFDRLSGGMWVLRSPKTILKARAPSIRKRNGTKRGSAASGSLDPDHLFSATVYDTTPIHGIASSSSGGGILGSAMLGSGSVSSPLNGGVGGCISGMAVKDGYVALSNRNLAPVFIFRHLTRQWALFPEKRDSLPPFQLLVKNIPTKEWVQMWLEMHHLSNGTETTVLRVMESGMTVCMPSLVPRFEFQMRPGSTSDPHRGIRLEVFDKSRTDAYARSSHSPTSTTTLPLMTPVPIPSSSVSSAPSPPPSSPSPRSSLPPSSTTWSSISSSASTSALTSTSTNSTSTEPISATTTSTPPTPPTPISSGSGHSKSPPRPLFTGRGPRPRASGFRGPEEEATSKKNIISYIQNMPYTWSDVLTTMCPSSSSASLSPVSPADTPPLLVPSTSASYVMDIPAKTTTGEPFHPSGPIGSCSHCHVPDASQQRSLGGKLDPVSAPGSSPGSFSMSRRRPSLSLSIATIKREDVTTPLHSSPPPTTPVSSPSPHRLLMTGSPPPPASPTSSLALPTLSPLTIRSPTSSSSSTVSLAPFASSSTSPSPSSSPTSTRLRMDLLSLHAFPPGSSSQPRPPTPSALPTPSIPLPGSATNSDSPLSPPPSPPPPVQVCIEVRTRSPLQAAKLAGETTTVLVAPDSPLLLYSQVFLFPNSPPVVLFYRLVSHFQRFPLHSPYLSFKNVPATIKSSEIHQFMAIEARPCQWENVPWMPHQTACVTCRNQWQGGSTSHTSTLANASSIRIKKLEPFSVLPNHESWPSATTESMTSTTPLATTAPKTASVSSHDTDMVTRDDWLYALVPPHSRTQKRQDRYVRTSIRPGTVVPQGWVVRRRLAVHLVPHLTQSYWERYGMTPNDIRHAIEILGAWDLWAACVARRIPVPLDSIKLAYGSTAITAGDPRHAGVLLTDHLTQTYWIPERLQHMGLFTPGKSSILKFEDKKKRFKATELGAMCSPITGSPTVLRRYTRHQPSLPITLVDNDTYDAFKASLHSNWASYNNVPCGRLFQWMGTTVVAYEIDTDSKMCVLTRVVPSHVYSLIHGAPYCLAQEPPELVTPEGAKWSMTDWSILVGRRVIHENGDGYKIGSSYLTWMWERRKAIETKSETKKKRIEVKTQILASLGSAAAAAAAASASVPASAPVPTTTPVPTPNPVPVLPVSSTSSASSTGNTTKPRPPSRSPSLSSTASTLSQLASPSVKTESKDPAEYKDHTKSLGSVATRTKSVLSPPSSSSSYLLSPTPLPPSPSSSPPPRVHFTSHSSKVTRPTSVLTPIALGVRG